MPQYGSRHSPRRSHIAGYYLRSDDGSGSSLSWKQCWRWQGRSMSLLRLNPTQLGRRYSLRTCCWNRQSTKGGLRLTRALGEMPRLQGRLLRDRRTRFLLRGWGSSLLRLSGIRIHVSMILCFGEGCGDGHTKVAVVPEMVRGSHTYVEVIKFVETHRSPMYLFSLSSIFFPLICILSLLAILFAKRARTTHITIPPTFTTALVWLVNVFEPTVAKVVHADQGPDRLVAVQYTLSFGAFPCQLLAFFLSLSSCFVSF